MNPLCVPGWKFNPDARHLADKFSDALGPVRTHDSEVTASQRAQQPVGLAY